MEGIPADVMKAYRDNITQMFFKREADHLARTGNPLHGPPGGAEPSKKRKLETKEELKARAAAHKETKRLEKVSVFRILACAMILML